jgi:hypothetical protein
VHEGNYCFRITGCYNPAPLKEISSRNLWEEGEYKKRWRRAQETMKDALTVEKRGYQDSWKSRISRSPRASCRLLSCYIIHSILFIWQFHQNFWMEKNFIKFHTNDDNFHWCKTSRPKRDSTWAEMTFSWIHRTRWVHEVVCEIIMTWLRSERHHAECWIEFANTRALLEQNGYRKSLANPQRHGSTINGHPGEYSVGNGRYVSNTRS